MNYILSWDKLLCVTRERTKSPVAANDYRHDFESDYDRIVFSAPFRRLQDKAQVFPLERSDFVRTRLTHSMEVAALARSIGVSIVRSIKQKNLIDDDHYLNYIPVVLETAGLAHDIGNPPFGHFGEESIRDSFKDWFDKHTDFTLTNQQKNDFLRFDGNCQMFRILTHLQCIKDSYGMNLTYATLSALMKYPFDSIKGNKDKAFCRDNGIHYKKFGYFSSEKVVAERVLEATGLKKGEISLRNPLAFILEAADDIAYTAGDLEDGFKKKLFSLREIAELFERYKEKDIYLIRTLERVRGIIDDNCYYSDEKKFQDIRIIIQGMMVEATVDSFVCNYDCMMNGNFRDELLEKSNASILHSILKEFSVERIFKNSEIEKTELGGEQAIKYLLNRFMSSMCRDDFIKHILDCNQSVSASQDRIYRLISAEYRKVFESRVEELKRNDKGLNSLKNDVYYYVCLMIVDYISGMTDNFCTELYKKLQGITNA